MNFQLLTYLIFSEIWRWYRKRKRRKSGSGHRRIPKQPKKKISSRNNAGKYWSHILFMVLVGVFVFQWYFFSCNLFPFVFRRITVRKRCHVTVSEFVFPPEPAHDRGRAKSRGHVCRRRVSNSWGFVNYDRNVFSLYCIDIIVSGHVTRIKKSSVCIGILLMYK